MNSYEFHIGDYYRRAKNLSQTEHYIYRSLLDECYLSETPLSTDLRVIMREIGLTTDQKHDLEYILNRFFILTPDGWVNDKVNKVLGKIYERSEKARQAALVKWNKRAKTPAETRSERMTEARKKGSHKKAQWLEMKEFFDNTCVKCLGSSGLANVEKDHIVPIYQGGSDGLDNIQPFCARCNAQKGPEAVDYRHAYCAVNGKVMPAEWLPNACEMPANACDTPAQRIPPSNPLTLLPPKERNGRFAPPSLDEVAEYQQEKDLNLAPDMFINFYESNGWKVGKNKMKDWKAAARGWSTRQHEKDKRTTDRPEPNHARVMRKIQADLSD